MQITKLHLLLLILLLGGGAYMVFNWRAAKLEESRKAQVQAQMARQRQVEEAEAADKAREAALASPPKAEPAPASSAGMPAVEAAKKEPEPVTYIVRRGDTLWKIAKMEQHFGKGHRWYDIWKANEDKIRDFDKIVRGQALVIPLDKPENYAWPKTAAAVQQELLEDKASPPPVPTN